MLLHQGKSDAPPHDGAEHKLLHPEIEVTCVANVFKRRMHFRYKGSVEFGHSHPLAHETLLTNGGLRVKVNGVTTDYWAPASIYIEKDYHHELTALADNTIAWCIHAIRGESLDDIIDPKSIPDGLRRQVVDIAVKRLTTEPVTYDGNTIVLNMRGLNCPLPILRTNKVLKGLGRGATVKVYATDPTAVEDFKSLCRTQGHEYLSDTTEDDGKVFVIQIKKNVIPQT